MGICSELIGTYAVSGYGVSSEWTALDNGLSSEWIAVGANRRLVCGFVL